MNKIKLPHLWRLANEKNYGREYMGIVRSTFLIDPKGNIAKIWNNVKVKEHVQNVKNELEKLR